MAEILRCTLDFNGIGDATVSIGAYQVEILGMLYFFVLDFAAVL